MYQKKKSCLSLGTMSYLKYKRIKPHINETVGKHLRVLRHTVIYTKPFILLCARVNFLGLFILRPTNKISKEIGALQLAFSPSI